MVFAAHPVRTQVGLQGGRFPPDGDGVTSVSATNTIIPSANIVNVRCGPEPMCFLAPSSSLNKPKGMNHHASDVLLAVRLAVAAKQAHRGHQIIKVVFVPQFRSLPIDLEARHYCVNYEFS